MRQHLFIARRTILEGETVELPADGQTSEDFVALGVVDTHDLGSIDLSVVASGDVNVSEANTAVRRVLMNLGETVPIEMPPGIRTVDDFFNALPAAAAETMFKREARQCSRCGEEKMFCTPKGSRMLCPDCDPLELI